MVLFHLQRHGLRGGYLGVDMFFVLSGYLITAIIYREAQAQQFSLRRFYERRVRRIMPALLLVLALSTVTAVAVLLPGDLLGFARSLLATLVFAANFYFWRDTDYFSPAAEQKPLLHIWSLGVEEQFYIFFPLVLVLLGRFLPRRTFAGIAVLSLASLAVNILAQKVGATLPAFFLLPARAWELGAGALLATAPPALAPRGRTCAALAWAGVGLVIAGILWPIEQSVYVPPALPVVAGTMLLLICGERGAPLPNRLLALRGVVFLGLISYSLYLWHWPVIVFGQYFLVRPFTWGQTLVALGVMLAGATLSWRYVERPFRDRALGFRRVALIVGTGVVALGAAALVLLKERGLPGRFPPAAAALNEAVGTNFRCAVSDYMAFGGSRACALNLPTRHPDDARVVLLGNSHAQMYAPVVSPILKARGLTGILVPANGCLPSVSVNIDRDCLDIAAANLAAILRLPHADTVILGLNWDHDTLVDAHGQALDNRDGRALVAGLDDLTGRLVAAGRRVILIGPLAEPGWDVPSVRARELAFGRPSSHADSIPREAFSGRFGSALQHFADRRDVTLVRPDRLQCPDERCYYVLEGRSLFADSNHLSSEALPRFSGAFAVALAPATAQ